MANLRNYVIDVAFTVEGPWKKFEDIPYAELVKGLERRMRYLKSADGQGEEPFGFDGDSYEVEPGFEMCQDCGLPSGHHHSYCKGVSRG